jgi:hypothetical protein
MAFADPPPEIVAIVTATRGSPWPATPDYCIATKGLASLAGRLAIPGEVPIAVISAAWPRTA